MNQRVLLAALALAFAASILSANVGPIIDTFTAVPAVPAPGQAVTLSISAHDPDCATSCSSGCGLTIRSDLLSWSDDTGRTTAFLNSQPAPTGSPWNATVTWIAPPAEGTYTVTAQVSDSGTFMCGGRATTLGKLTITVTTAPPPVIDSISLTPQSVPVGGSADIAVVAHDPLGRALTYSFTADAGTIARVLPSTPLARWTAPQFAGNIAIRATVSASNGPSVTTQTTATVQIGSFSGMAILANTRATRIAPLPDGRIAVVDGASGTLQLTTTTGSRSWNRAGLSTPAAVAYADGEIYVLERGASRISVWDLSGARLRDLPVSAAAPNNITAGPAAGELAISDLGTAAVIVIATTDGRTLRTLGSGSLAAPAGLAVSKGRLAVADAALGRIIVFDATGTPSTTLGDDTLLIRPQGLAWDSASTRLVVTDAFSAEIVILGEEGTVRGSLGGFGGGTGQLVNPIDVALLPGGMLAVTTASGKVPLYRLLNSLPPVAAPGKVTAADRIGDDGGAVGVSWTASNDDPPRVTGYIVKRATGETANYLPAGRVSAGVTSFIDTTTVDGTCYHYEVLASDGVSETASQPTACAYSRNDLPPPAPAQASATPQSPFAIRVAWMPVSTPDLAAYVIGIGARSVRAAKGDTSVLVDGLTPETTYPVSVTSVDTANNASSPATASVTTYPDAAPPAPASVAATDAGIGGTIDVTWAEPPSRVPVADYTITLAPTPAGWPVVAHTSKASPAHISGLVNKLSYSITITASTPWRRAGDPSAAVATIPTAPLRPLPVIAETTRQDSAGVSVTFAISETRELRFQYRSTGPLDLYLDGDRLPVIFPATAGSWTDARVEIEKRLLKKEAVHTLELRNRSFPDPLSELTLRRIDFVPLFPRHLETEEMNTVVDLKWEWQETRSDLSVMVEHSGEKKGGYTAIACAGAIVARCRDPFLPNGEKFEYRFSITSPAGWSSAIVDVSGRARYDDFPPPVTDLRIEDAIAGRQLNWSPISTALSKNGAPVAVPLYRIYRQDGAALTQAGETAAPPFAIPSGDFKYVVRSVDAQGRESR